FAGGVQVTAGDSNGDGRADIAVAPAHGSSHVKIFDGLSMGLLQSFMAFTGFGGDITISFEPSVGLPSRLFVGTATLGSTGKGFGNGTEQQSFLAFPGFTGGVQLAVGDTNSDGQNEVVVLAVGTNHVKVFSAAQLLDSFLAAPGPDVDLGASLL